MIRVVVPIRVKSGMKENFFNVAQSLIEETRKEKGCIEYFLVNTEEENKIFFIESWETEEDLKNHLKTPHFKKYGEELSKLRESDSTIEVYNTKRESTVFKRRSVREFTNKDVDQDTIDRILKAGMLAPSAGNQQGWEFIVVRNKKVLEELAKISPYSSPIANAGVAIIVLGETKAKFPQNLEQDLSAATENILLQITEEGLGGVWLGVAPEVDRIEKVKKLLKLEESVFPFAMIPFGYPLENMKKIDRWNPGKVRYID